MKKSLKRKIKYMFISIFVFPILVAIAVILFAFSVLAYDKIFYNTHLIPKAKSVPLDNGFLFVRREYIGVGRNYKRRFVLDKDNKFVTDDGVIGLMAVDNLVYGKLDKGFANIEYDYFFCEYGTDCSKTKNLEKSELDKILKDKKLPALTERNMETYKSLLTKDWLKRIFTLDWNSWDNEELNCCR